MHRRENFYRFVSTSWFSFPLFPYFLYPVTGGKIKGWSLADSLICHFLLKRDDLTEKNKNLGWWILISKSSFWPWARIWVFVSHITAKCPAPQNYFGLHIYSCIIFFCFFLSFSLCTLWRHEAAWFFRTGKAVSTATVPLSWHENLTSVTKWVT